MRVAAQIKIFTMNIEIHITSTFENIYVRLKSDWSNKLHYDNKSSLTLPSVITLNKQGGLLLPRETRQIRRFLSC